jgi:hypothetical protein
LLLALSAGPIALALVLFAVRLNVARSSAATARVDAPSPVVGAAPLTDWTVQAHGATDDEALVAARGEALRQLLEHVRAALPAATRAAALSGPADDASRVAARFDRDVGAIASPERVQVEAAVDPAATDRAGVTFRVHYHLAPEAFARLVAFYGDTVGIDGISFAHAFPDRADGLVAVEVDGRYPDIKPGARLERFDEHPAESLDALRRLASSSSSSQQHHASFRQAGTSLSLTLPPS